MNHHKNPYFSQKTNKTLPPTTIKVQPLYQIFYPAMQFYLQPINETLDLT